MKRQLFILLALCATLVFTAEKSANADDHGGHGHNASHGHSFGHGFGGRGFGFNRGFSALGVGGDFSYGWDIADLYRQLYQNLPYFALHPPVYYSYPVPRTYGYSPFAYGPEIMTPDVVQESKPVTIDNPYVPLKKAAPADASKATDRSASAASAPEPLVITNPFVTPAASVAQSGS